ncbi:MAG: hypothetical protein R6U32_02130 [Candidatus Woesearchaeota archaeon]
MNNKYQPSGYYGEIDRKIYEDAISGRTDPAAVAALSGRNIDLTPPLFDRVLDRIFGTYKRIDKQMEEHRRAQEEAHHE